MILSKQIKSTLLFTLAALFALPLSAQTNVTTDDIREMVSFNLIPTFQTTNVKGNPYIADNFVTGSFELYSGAKTENLEMNYNIYENRIEIVDGNQVYAVSADDVKEFVVKLNGEERVYRKGFESRRLDANHFVEVKADGAMSFLVKQEVNYSENSSAGYGSASKEEVYSKNKRYYIEKDGEVHELRRLRHRRVVKHFEGNKQVNNYIKENDLDLSNPDHINKAVKKYNEITS
ncbi:hypothetical protein [Gracilimonas sp. BCB1]|uniref:hypothetical protein n=1 Tax=Gracilimonas sp. BCB1 TaxID=3152362 RepID=UPI0032D90E88